MKCFILFLYNFYRYAVILVFALLGITLALHDITFTTLLFWIIMFFMSLVQFFAYCNGLKAQLEKRFVNTYNDTVIQNIEQHKNEFKNN